MDTIEQRPQGLVGVAVPYIQWSAVIAGAIAAAAISFILLGFGTAIGLAFASSSPTWRDLSLALALLSGLYLIFVALASFGFGGYLAGRMRTRFTARSAAEHEFRDGMHGVLAWGVAVLIGALIAVATLGSLTPAPASGPAGSVVGETTIAYELDQLFRGERRVADTDIAWRRAEAARILLKAASRDGIAPEDHDYLVQTVSGRAGLAPAEAQARVDDIIARAKQAIERARHAAVLEAFMTAAALLLGAGAAWFASRVGGRDREREALPTWAWSRRRTTAAI